IVAERLDDAIKDFLDALGFARRRKAGLESEPRIAADLANAYLLKRDFSFAISAATEAINIATARHTRFAECLASIVRGGALCASPGGGDLAEAKQALSRAEALIQEAGLVILEPLIHAARLNFRSTSAPRGKSALVG